MILLNQALKNSNTKIKKIGLYNSKASNIYNTSNILKKEFFSEVPREFEKFNRFWAKARVCADLLIDFSPQNVLFKQEYLHVCTVKDEAGENAMMSNQSQWEGRLNAVKREIKGVRDEMGGLEEQWQ